MTTRKERKSLTELERLALGIVRRMQGCGHVEAVTITPHPQKGWAISGCTPGHADDSDVGRAILVAQSDLRERYDFAWEDDNTG
jgi:hypothetical protein